MESAFAQARKAPARKRTSGPLEMAHAQYEGFHYFWKKCYS